MSDYTAKTLTRRINQLGKKTEAWRNEVQECLIGCCFQALEKDNNIDPCIQIVKQLRGSDLKAIMHWLERNAPVRIKGGSFVFNKSFEGYFDEEKLRADKWYESAIKPEQVPTSLDCMDAVRSLIKRLEREITKAERPIENAEIVAKLRLFAAENGAIAKV